MDGRGCYLRSDPHDREHHGAEGLRVSQRHSCRRDGATTVSTGRPGHVTPTVVFTVLQKQKEHRSTIYDGAPATHVGRCRAARGWIAGLSGIARLHPPAQRICEGLYDISPPGMTVVIADTASEPTWVTHPRYLAPTSIIGGNLLTPIPRLE
jgi:hypothetical protein